jgi:predicted transcriptional regulator
MPNPKKGEQGRAEQLEAPNAGELDVLAVLWLERLGSRQPLQLSEVYRRVCERRRQFGEQEPALTTVSTHLRGLVAKKLIEEVLGSRATAAGAGTRARGAYSPPTRSPLTSYQALHEPGDVLKTTFQGLAAAYPAAQRLDALTDFAHALELSKECLRKLEQLIAAEKARGTGTTAQ